MKIYEDYSSTYPDALNYYWNFKKFSNDDSSDAVFFGWAYMDHLSHYIDTIRQYEKKIYLNTEQPCSFQTGDEKQISLSLDSGKNFSKVFTFCPYTANWANLIEQDDRFKYIFTPFNKDFIVNEKQNKQFDALYWGGMHGFDHKDIIDSIKEHKYNFLTVGPQTWSLWWGREGVLPPIQQYVSYITGVSIKRTMMWKLLRRTKVNVMANLLYTNEKINNNVKSLDQWEKNEAFSNLEQFIMPQIKSRPIETAVNRCLMVVKKDPWNIQEDFFEPDKEFIYYNDKKELQSILK